MSVFIGEHPCHCKGLFSIFLPFGAHSLVETYLNLYRRVVVVDEGGEKSCIDGGAEALFPVRGESEATFTSPS